MAKRITVKDVAREAEVSVATVDRVLNSREYVRPETAKIVYAAAHRIGFHAAGLLGQGLLAERPEIKFGFVLPKEKQDFYRSFSQRLEDAIRNLDLVRGSSIIEFSPSQSPEDFSELIRGMEGRVDVVAATTIAHHEIAEAVGHLKQAGVPTFALLTDFAQGIRHGYVGLNNLKVGRIASWAITATAKSAGKTAVFVGSHRWLGHELRETGFRSHLREFAPDFTILDTLINLDTRQLTYEATLDLLARHRDLKGLFIAGGGMEGAISAVREVREPGDVSLVVTELTNVTARALSDRYLTMAIATPQEMVCQELVKLMYQATQENMTGSSMQSFLQPQIFVPESI